MEVKKVFDWVEVLASGARSITGAGSAARLAEPSQVLNGVAFQVDLTAAATAVTDTLDLYIETMMDGVNWNRIAHFTQMVGNGGAKRFVIVVPVLASLVTLGQQNEEADALDEGAVRSMFGDQYRALWEIADISGLAEFTFSVKALVF